MIVIVVSRHSASASPELMSPVSKDCRRRYVKIVKYKVPKRQHRTALYALPVRQKTRGTSAPRDLEILPHSLRHSSQLPDYTSLFWTNPPEIPLANHQDADFFEQEVPAQFLRQHTPRALPRSACTTPFRALRPSLRRHNAARKLFPDSSDSATIRATRSESQDYDGG